MKATSRRVVVTRHGGPEVLDTIEEEIPEPAPGEARVRVLAAGVSAYDLMFRRSGRLPGTPRVPFTLGVDVVGVVDEVRPPEPMDSAGHAGLGPVSGLEPGQVVAGATFSRGSRGGYAEYVCLPAADLVPVPADVDPAEAVCLVVNYLTAAAMLQFPGNVRAGERVLVHGAAGGVGSALVQLGRLLDLDIYATASAHNCDLVSGLGAVAIDYRNEDFVARIRTLTGGAQGGVQGVDVVFDPVGGAYQLWRDYQTLRPGGRLVWFGVAATREHGLGVIPPTLAMRSFLALIPDGRRAPLPPDLEKLGNAWYRDTLSALLALLAAGHVRPLVAGRIPLSQASRAHELLEQGGHAGKFVLVPERWSAEVS